MLKVGDKAPDISLMSDEGPVNLKDFAGKKVILYFYPKDDTSGCTKEACDFKDNIRLIGEKNAIVIGISKDNIASHKKFKEKFNLPFKLLSDENIDVIKKYDVWKEKSNYGKKYMGTERATFIIDENGKIQEIFRNVKVDGHIQQVLEKI